MSLEFRGVFRSAVGQGMFGLGPDKFIGVELRGIGRKGIDVEPGLLVNKVADHLALVDGSTIPEQDHRSPKMVQEVAQKPDNLHARDVDPVELHIESQPLIPWGYREAGDGGDPIPPITVVQEGCSSHRCPGLTDVGDEQEPALVEESQMGLKSSGFFLYGASSASSSVRWPLGPSGSPVVPAFANSISVPRAAASILPRWSSEPQSVARPASQSASGSTSRWSNRLASLPAIAIALTARSASSTSAGVAQGSDEHATPLASPCGKLDTSAPQSSKMPLRCLPRPGTFLLLAAELWRDVCDLPTAWQYQEVSYPVV